MYHIIIVDVSMLHACLYHAWEMKFKINLVFKINYILFV